MVDRGDAVRLDIWLWAGQAIELGRVLVAGERAKRARLVRVSDEIVVRHPPFERTVVVRGLSDTRGPASVATQLYEETAESSAAREKLAAQMRALGPSVVRHEAGRPTKKERRDMDRWKGPR